MGGRKTEGWETMDGVEVMDVATTTSGIGVGVFVLLRTVSG
jgi:hypothetical protein